MPDDGSDEPEHVVHHRIALKCCYTYQYAQSQPTHTLQTILLCGN